MFKVNDKDTRTNDAFGTYFTSYSNVSIVNFEHAIAGSGKLLIYQTKMLRFIYSCIRKIHITIWRSKSWELSQLEVLHCLSRMPTKMSNYHRAIMIKLLNEQGS